MTSVELSRAIRSSGKTAYKIAQMSGVNRSTLSRILNNKQEPKSETITKIIKVL
jgi:transcriptional regulator with XRE-family HTH domain